MKKIFFTLVLFTVVFNASSQTEKTTWLVGADVAGLNYGFDSEDFNISLVPRVGYFVVDNVAIGGTGILNILSPNVGDTQTTWGIGPFARGYFGEMAKSKFFGQASFLLTGFDNGNISSTTWQLGATVGNAWFLNKHVALEVGLGYTFTKPEDIDGTSDIGLTLGFQIHLPSKK